jgi:hypothetical protein
LQFDRLDRLFGGCGHIACAPFSRNKVRLIGHSDFVDQLLFFRPVTTTGRSHPGTERVERDIKILRLPEDFRMLAVAAPDGLGPVRRA